MSASATIADAGPALWLRLARAQSGRFWAKVDRSGECWLWTAGQDKDGYGKFAITLPRETGKPLQKHVRAHRVAWSLASGAWFPEDAVAMHHCDTPACVRPDHVRPGTQAENRADSGAKGRNALGERVGSAKLDRDLVRAAKALFATGMPVAEVARELGVRRTILYAVRDGRTWRHVG